MAQITLPANIKNGDPLDADQVMANDQIIVAGMNGGLEATSNVKVAPAVTQNGQANLTGVSASLAAADHSHMIQGFENRAADPTTQNFLGRVYWNTANARFRYCTATAGSGTYADLTPTALSLVLHAAQHADGGHDPLPDLCISDHMKAQRVIATVSLGADVTNISASTYTAICNMTLPASMLVQTVLVNVVCHVENTTTNNPWVGFRVLDMTVAGTPTIWRAWIHRLGSTGQPATYAHLGYSFFYQLPTAGARVLRLQAGSSQAGVDFKAPAAFNGDSTDQPIMQAVVI